MRKIWIDFLHFNLKKSELHLCKPLTYFLHPNPLFLASKGWSKFIMGYTQVGHSRENKFSNGDFFILFSISDEKQSDLQMIKKWIKLNELTTIFI